MPESVQKPNNTMIQPRTAVSPPVRNQRLCLNQAITTPQVRPLALWTCHRNTNSTVLHYQDPTGLTRRNRLHLRPAAPPPREALIPRSWTKQLSAKTPTTVTVDHSSKQLKPELPSSSPEGSRQSTPYNQTQTNPAKTAPGLVAASAQIGLQFNIYLIF